MTNSINNGQALDVESANVMWQGLAERLVSTLMKLYPGASKADLLALSSLESMAAAEKHDSLPAEGIAALKQYLDGLAFFREGGVESAQQQHAYLTMQIPGLLAAG